MLQSLGEIVYEARQENSSSLRSLGRKVRKSKVPKLVAVIPTRSGSQRVVNKNTVPFAEKSLLEWKIETIRTLPVDEIVVNTNCPATMEIARSYGLAIHERDAYHASNECTNSEYHEYLAKSTNGEVLLIAQVTAPLISRESYLRGIEVMKSGEFDSVMSVRRFRKHLWQKGKPYNYDLRDAPNSQELEPFDELTYGVVLAERDVMKKNRSMIGDRPYFLPLEDLENCDIDTPLDFEISEYLFRKYRMPSE